MRELELGVAIRFVKGFNEADAQNVTPFDVAVVSTLVSCLVLGHTFEYNVDETVCNVCGTPKEQHAEVPREKA